jgi:ribosomal protein S18 acetylase RimI-like enzyme
LLPIDEQLTMSATFRIETAGSNDWAGAFALVFQHLREEERAVRVQNAVQLVEKGEMNAHGIFVARKKGQLAGALVCLPVAGAAALVWPPQSSLAGDRERVEDALLRQAARWLRRNGAKLAQALLAPADSQLAGALLRNGFTHPTTLCYMRHDLQRLGRLISPLEMEPFKSCDQAVFRATLERTYEETLDCPEVNGARTIEEVLEGHRSQGIHDPNRWWLARRGGKPIGVLLVTEVPEWEGWDLSYVGVVPEARRQGLGRHLTLAALAEAQRGGANEVTLSVDIRNVPACAMYRRIGFRAYDRREVYLIIWRDRVSKRGD